ncbi:MAG TPA: hypothetical protein VJB58_01345 [Candidatus Paceibacterota bacterium]
MAASAGMFYSSDCETFHRFTEELLEDNKFFSDNFLFEGIRLITGEIIYQRAGGPNPEVKISTVPGPRYEWTCRCCKKTIYREIKFDWSGPAFYCYECMDTADRLPN